MGKKEMRAAAAASGGAGGGAAYAGCGTSAGLRVRVCAYACARIRQYGDAFRGRSSPEIGQTSKFTHIHACMEIVMVYRAAFEIFFNLYKYCKRTPDEKVLKNPKLDESLAGHCYLDITELGTSVILVRTPTEPRNRRLVTFREVIRPKYSALIQSLENDGPFRQDSATDIIRLSRCCLSLAARSERCNYASLFLKYAFGVLRLREEYRQ
ncbi:hypothetical protein EVAR_5033_1 [Eumeta japonica]|uniref:Uncharacterized protein n=1 Tax=Eumeta variegata TaxID=151549 RepID=A0A4C1SU45_EUMVA|nr:hypothetical protein EVAR_5033_1 [Eumeta japonica]